MKIELLFFYKDSKLGDIQIKEIQKMLESLDCLTLSEEEIEFQGESVSYNLTLSPNEKYVCLTLVKDGDNKKTASKLSDLKQVIIGGKHRNKYHINTLYDGSSFYYQKKLFPIIAKFERSLRKLIYLIVIDAFGSEWVKLTIEDEFQDQLKRKDKHGKNIEYIIENALQEFSFSDYVTFLFEEKKFVFEDEYIDQLSSQLKDGINIEELAKELEKFKTYTVWDKLFSDLELSEAKDTIKSVGHVRNIVMHSKDIKTEIFDTEKKKIIGLNSEINKAIQYVERDQISEENSVFVMESVVNALEEATSRLAKIRECYTPHIEAMENAIASIRPALEFQKNNLVFYQLQNQFKKINLPHIPAEVIKSLILAQSALKPLNSQQKHQMETLANLIDKTNFYKYIDMFPDVNNLEIENQNQDKDDDCESEDEDQL